MGELILFSKKTLSCREPRLANRVKPGEKQTAKVLMFTTLRAKDEKARKRGKSQGAL